MVTFGCLCLQVCVGESVEFEHRDTGVTVSTAGILAGERQGWTEVGMLMVAVDLWSVME